MSKRRVPHAFVLAAAAAAALLTGAWGLANAATVEQTLDTVALSASEPPALLGPITENGRVGWECKPERAAMAKKANSAELPPR